MAYLGNAPAEKYISFERQVFTIVNSQTAYTLSHSVTNENDIRLVVNNIVQEPGSGKAYTASGTTLTLSAALVNGTDEMYCVFLGRAVGTVNAPAGSVSTSQLAGDAVTEAKIADGAVESEHLNNNVISGQTELAAEPADTDEFLISDAGTIKRIDYSLIKAGGMVKLFSSTPTNVSTIDINGYFTSDYDAYIIYAQNYYGVSTGGYLRIRGMVSGSAVTSSDYYTSAKGKYSQSGSSGDIDEAGWNADNMRLEGNKGGSYTYSGSSTITIYNPLSTSMAKIITQFSSGFRNTTQYESVIGGGTLNTTSALSGVQLAWNSGNVTMSKLAMYGVKV